MAESKKIEKAGKHMTKARAALAEAIGTVFPICDNAPRQEWRDDVIRIMKDVDLSLSNLGRWESDAFTSAEE
jgi:hypothetical protein